MMKDRSLLVCMNGRFASPLEGECISLPVLGRYIVKFRCGYPRDTCLIILDIMSILCCSCLFASPIDLRGPLRPMNSPRPLISRSPLTTLLSVGVLLGRRYGSQVIVWHQGLLVLSQLCSRVPNRIRKDDRD